jgi:hypothetical protein
MCEPVSARAAIPTTYRGYEMRSRTEARWAAFFDLLGWRWEYEPFDGDGYIPDFVLMGADPVLVEVKPGLALSELPLHAPKVLAGVEGLWRHDVLIVGSTPFPVDDVSRYPSEWHPAMGLLYEHDPALVEAVPNYPYWWDGVAEWITCTACDQTSFKHDEACFRSRLCGHYDGDSYLGRVNRTALDTAWAKATNLARWLPSS